LPATLRRAAGALTALVATAGLVGTAAAAEVAADADTAVRDITFPVDGTYQYTDTFGDSRSGGRGHQGTDIMTPKLTELVAARDATVVGLKSTATPDGSEGNYLMLEDEQGWEYWYIHLNNDSPGTDDGANPDEWIFGPGVEKGSRVAAGQLVAYAGDSGNAEGAGSHLHFEIHKPDGSVINPYQSLQRAEGADDREASPQYVASEDDERYVRALALDFLDRPATEEEVRRDVGRLASGTSKADVVAGYAESDEWVSALVTAFYEATLDRQPDEEGLQHWIDEIAGGATPAEVAAHFYGSDEYVNAAGGTHRDWITDLYREVLLREPDQEGLDHWVGKADAGVHRGTIAGSFYASLESRHTRVEGLYEALLGRLPDQRGLAHWSDRLRDGEDIELAVALAVSPEYYERASARTDTQ